MASKSGSKRKMDKSDESSGSKRGRKRGKAKQFPLNMKMFEPEVGWNMKEKERLVAALRIFAPTSIHSLSRYVKTKKPEEIAAKIASIRAVSASASQVQKLEGVGDDSTGKKAPLELWLPLVRDLVVQESTDLSENISEVIGLIGRTEVPNESLSSKLNWKNIYQYISDLLADRQHLQALSDLESLVILDVMHSMADTLRSSDTEEQRRLMTLKYKYMLADHLCYPQFSKREQMMAMALSNDFSSVEKETRATSSSSSLPASSISHMVLIDESGVGTSSSSHPPISSCAARSVLIECDEGQSTSTKVNSKPQSSSSLTSIKTQSMNFTKDWTTTSLDNVANSSDQSVSKKSQSNTAWSPDSGYCRPRYYTLNPFCIPNHLLDFNTMKK